MDDIRPRCGWCNLSNPVYVAYHDAEWAVPSHDDHHLFEMLVLETFQAGLSWETILNKRKRFRQAFDGFDIERIRRYDENKLAVIGVCWIIIVVVVALTADLWAKPWLGSPTASDSTTMAETSLLAPCAEHPFGTDALGRDILVRVIYGARVSLSVGIMATAISTLIGLVMGALAGFYGGIWDTIIMRCADIFLAFPYQRGS